MSYSSNSAIFNSTAAQVLLLKKTKNKQNQTKHLFPHSGFLCQTAVCSGNFYSTMAFWQTWQGIQMCSETEPGLGPLKKAIIKPTSCGIKTTAKLFCYVQLKVVDGAYDETWLGIHARTLYFCLYLKHDCAFDSWDGMRQLLHPGLQRGHRHHSTDDKTDWTDLAAQMTGCPVCFFLLQSPCATVLLSEKKRTEPNHQWNRLNQTEAGRALSRLSQAIAGNSGMPCSAQ